MTYNPATGELHGNWSSERKLVWAGGWFTKAFIADDGTIIAGSDVDGPWFLPPGADAWIKCFRPGENYDLSPEEYIGDDGCWDVALCATDSNYMGWIQGGWLWLTDDGCVTVRRSELPKIADTSPNGFDRMVGKPLAIDPINPEHIIVATAAGLRRSADGGYNWTSISTGTVPAPAVLSQLQYNSRGATMTVGQTVTGATSGATGILMVDQVDEGINTLPYGSLYIRAASGTFQQGENLQVSGVTKAVCSGQQKLIGPLRTCVAFDRSSGATSGRTTTCRAFVLGSGLHSSTNGGGTWGAAASGTANFTPASLTINGTTGRIHMAGWCAGLELPGVASQYRYSDNTTSWTAPSGVQGKVLVISSQNNAHHYLITAGGGYRFSSDSGATWGDLTNTYFNATQAKYIAMTDAGGFKSNGTALFDPTQNRLWMTEGVGVWYVDNPPTNGATITWTDIIENAENMIVSYIDISPNGTRRIGQHDKCGVVLSKGQIGKSSASRTSVTGLFCHGTNIAISPDDPNFMVQGNFYDKRYQDGPNIGKLTEQSRGGWSADGGKTWNLFGSHIGDDLNGYGGGNIISFSNDVHIQCMTSNAGLGWTKDNGASPWTRLVIGNGAVTRNHKVYYINHRVLVADPYVPNRAYVYMCDDNQVDADAPYDLQDLIDTRGIWQIDYDPDTQTMSTDRITDTWIVDLRDYNGGHMIPYGPGDWLWLCQDNSNGGLRRSKDNMATWQQMPMSGDGYTNAVFGNLFAAAVGCPAYPGGPKPILFFGWRDPARPGNGDYSSWGAWICMDPDAPSPILTRIMQWPGQSHTVQRAVAAGDPGFFGSFTIGGSGGAVDISFSDVRRGR